MVKLNIKPLSVNQAWKGRRFKTSEYKAFERTVLLMLPRKLEIPEGPITLKLEFGFSNSNSDIDNPVKMFIDCLQKKYKFNDKRICELNIKKRPVKKGDEFINFKIGKL